MLEENDITLFPEYILSLYKGSPQGPLAAHTAMAALSRATDSGHPCKMPFVALNGPPTPPAVRNRRTRRSYIVRSGPRMRGDRPITSTSWSMIFCGSRSKHFDQSSETPKHGSPLSSASSSRSCSA